MISTFRMIIFILFVCVFLINVSVADESVFRYAKDAAPISYVGTAYGGASTVQGFCKRLFGDLKKEYTEMKAVGIDVGERQLEGVNQNTLGYGLECGATTITSDREGELEKKNAWFSKPFYASELALIIKKDSLEKLKNGQKITIATITTRNNQKELTTIESLKAIFPSAQITRLDTRDDAYNGLMNNSFDAYASDKILLQDLIYYNPGNGKGKSLLDAGFIIHSDSYTTEPYGIMVYHNKELLRDVNDWIDGDGKRNALREISEKIKAEEDGQLSFYRKIMKNHPNVIFVLLSIASIILLYHFFKSIQLKLRKVIADHQYKSTLKIVLPKNMSKEDFISAMRKIAEGEFDKQEVLSNGQNEKESSFNSQERNSIKESIDEFFKNGSKKAGETIGAEIAGTIIQFARDEK